MQGKLFQRCCTFFVLQCAAFGRKSKHKTDVTAWHGIHFHKNNLFKYSDASILVYKFHPERTGFNMYISRNVHTQHSFRLLYSFKGTGYSTKHDSWWIVLSVFFHKLLSCLIRNKLQKGFNIYYSTWKKTLKPFTNCHASRGCLCG